MTELERATGVEGGIALTAELSANVLDFLRVREIELTKRHEIAAKRDVEIEKIRNFAQIVIAAINGVTQTKQVLIAAVSEGIRDAIAAGNTEVALELSGVLASMGSTTHSISRGLRALTGRPSIEQA